MSKQQTNFRLSKSAKAQIRQAAKAAGLSQAVFVERAVHEKWKKVIEMADRERKLALESILNGKEDAKKD